MILKAISIFCSVVAVASAQVSYTSTAGGICASGYIPITSWEVCQTAGDVLGYQEYKKMSHSELPQGCFYWDGFPIHLYFNQIQGIDVSYGDVVDGDEGTDHIICELAEPTETTSPTSSPTTSPTSSPTTLKSKEINPFQVLAIGAGTAESPYGTATGNDGELVIDTFFEASKSDFNDGVTIEVYAGVKDDEEDCTQGATVPKTDYTTESLQYADYSGPQATSDGVVGIARVTIPDFTTLSSILLPMKDGTIKLCVVTAIKIDYYGNGAKDYSVSQLNSKRSISVALVGSIAEGGQMKQVIEVTESKATTSESKAVLSVVVDTILCNNKNDPVREDKSYVTGQQFRICVGPTKDGVAKGYQVDQYLEVKCGERTLFSTEKGTDALTNIDDENKNDKRAIRSVLTVEDAAAAAVIDGTGTSTFTCTGKVSLSYTSPVVDDELRALRNLLPASTGVVVPSSSGGAEAEAVLEGLFDVTIQMETPSMNESSSAPPGPTSKTTRTTVAVMGVIVVVGSLLSVVSSMLG